MSSPGKTPTPKPRSMARPVPKPRMTGKDKTEPSGLVKRGTLQPSPPPNPKSLAAGKFSTLRFADGERAQHADPTGEKLLVPVKDTRSEVLRKSPVSKSEKSRTTRAALYNQHIRSKDAASRRPLAFGEYTATTIYGLHQSKDTRSKLSDKSSTDKENVEDKHERLGSGHRLQMALRAANTTESLKRGEAAMDQRKIGRSSRGRLRLLPEAESRKEDSRSERAKNEKEREKEREKKGEEKEEEIRKFFLLIYSSLDF
ncbi:hypothetical protein EGW08_021674 [Elysia chlorotica]|uniref:Uncharacterized protein n=1 Tax=Elysia chlorotica TaxID=188477 RepID=A0A3S1AS53_ELYCH|nr:hypothetical protein EGW08_021674 [Elysia chlorotica]